MLRSLLLSLIICVTASAQQYKIENAKGNVYLQKGTSEEWVSVTEKTEAHQNSTLMTDKKSSVVVSNGGLSIKLGEYSVVPLNSIKKMSIDDLLLALAMDNLLNAPRKKENKNGSSTAVYGTKEDGKTIETFTGKQIGEMRLNAAKQLALNGLKESSIVLAKETYRKYPETRGMIPFRIFFADVLFDLSLYEEALSEYSSVKNEKLSKEQSVHIESKLSEIAAKITSAG